VSNEWIGLLAWAAAGFGATVILLLGVVIWLRPPGFSTPLLLPLLGIAALALAMGTVRLMLGHIRGELARKERLLGKISRRLSEVLRDDGPSQSTASTEIELRLDQVLTGYRGAVGLEARVAELEAELRAEQQGQNTPRGRDGDAGAVEGASIDGGEGTEVIERVRRLTETSFVAGSDALVRVRATLRALSDWRQRLADDPRQPPEAQQAPAREDRAARASGGSQPVALEVQVFESLAAEVQQLSSCASRLRPIADAAEMAARLEPSVSHPKPAASLSSAAHGSNPASPGLDHPSAGDPPAGDPEPSSHLLLTALKMRGLAAELESGLVGLGTEVRVLGRAWRPRAEDGVRGVLRNGPDPALVRALDRLEIQLTEVADDIAAFTRDAEQLSRELDRMRASGRRPAGD
jgi:hypothetical protein